MQPNWQHSESIMMNTDTLLSSLLFSLVISIPNVQIDWRGNGNKKYNNARHRIIKMSSREAQRMNHYKLWTIQYGTTDKLKKENQDTKKGIETKRCNSCSN